jgi:hypothetical protein
MKTSKAYYYQGKFKYLEGDKWPKEPVSYGVGDEQYYGCRLAEYQEALTSALKEAIDFEDYLRIAKMVITQMGIFR